METTTRKFLDDLMMPDYSVTLLELYGITHIEDLLGFDADSITELEERVRDRTIFGGEIDFESKQLRKKYLGFEVAEVGQFSFRPIVKKKLLLLSAKAKAKMEANLNVDKFPSNSTLKR